MTLIDEVNGEVPPVSLPQGTVEFPEIHLWHNGTKKAFPLNPDARGVDFSEIEKAVRQAFSSIGGKAAIANKLIPLFPPHDVYVEAFAGGAAVYFKKEPIEREVLSDMTDQVVYLYQTIQSLTDEQISALSRRNWRARQALHQPLSQARRLWFRRS
jgi:hypothetical protein